MAAPGGLPRAGGVGALEMNTPLMLEGGKVIDMGMLVKGEGGVYRLPAPPRVLALPAPPEVLLLENGGNTADIAILRSIKRYSERLVRGDVSSSNFATMARVRRIRAAITNGKYNTAGARFHSLNFGMVRSLKLRGFLSRFDVDKSISTPGGFLPSRRPDYLFNSGAGDIFDIKPFRPNRDAYDNTEQFQDIQGARGVMPVPFYYRLW